MLETFWTLSLSVRGCSDQRRAVIFGVLSCPTKVILTGGERESCKGN